MSADRTLAPFGRRRARGRQRAAVGAYVILELADRDGPAPQPGQFYMLAAAAGWGAGEDERPFLPRAFSAMGGAGRRRCGSCSRTSARARTAWRRCARARPSGCSARSAGRSPHPQDGRRPLLCGGGIGLPPLVFLSRRAAATPAWRRCSSSASATPRHAQVAAGFARAQLATDDGSAGHHGL